MRRLPAPLAVLSWSLLSLSASGAEPIASWERIDGAKEIPAAEAPPLGKGDFSLSLWLDAGEGPGGDLASQYDPAKRRGFHLSLKSNPGVVSNQANWRHLQFGIDDDRDSGWIDCGRPGQALFAVSLAVHDGALYAGTCEPGKGESGRVYRYDEGAWVNCGAPDGSNSVTSLAVHDGALYAGTGKYRVSGSSLPESENTTPGGRIFRYEGGARWTDCGKISAEAVGGMVVHQGKLHASSLYRPAGFFRHEGGKEWTSLPVPPGPSEPYRVVPLTVHGGELYAGSYDNGSVYRFDGESWTNCGKLGDNTQTYSFASFRGALVAGTWRSGRVYRFDGLNQWTDLGRLGEELEVMGMLVHNGRLLGGTLPLAEVHQYEGGTTWKRLAQLDATPDVKYRRAWAMAEHAGQVFCSTLPSGSVHAFAAGAQVQWGHPLAAGWRHVVATKTAERLELYLDGQPVASLERPGLADYDLSSDVPLRLGSGENGPFEGAIRDLRLYQGRLSVEEITRLSRMIPSP